jgi:23S rRNA (adenine2503-C2)-methyltransferase
MITRNIKVPTGNIYTMEGEKGVLEFLSIGDYGKDLNIKADFLGINRELNGVPNGEIQPLSEKWVITISTQYGCSMNCTFCDVPLVGKGVNATYYDMLNQIKFALQEHPEIAKTKRLNIHFARMGEPTFNGNVLDIATCLKRHIYDFWINSVTVHPVVSTMMPKNNKYLEKFLSIWCNDIKNNLYQGEAGLQLSINSTDNYQRKEMFSNNSLSLEEVAEIAKKFPKPKGRKYTLNFALADDYIVDANKLACLFNPEHFMCKITPLHKTQSCDKNGIITTNGYEVFTPYKETETNLKNAGFDVIVFVPSYDEDLGMITCGNAILSGNNPKVPYMELI